jgi:hypothetical protein
MPKNGIGNMILKKPRPVENKETNKTCKCIHKGKHVPYTAVPTVIT